MDAIFSFCSAFSYTLIHPVNNLINNSDNNSDNKNDEAPSFAEADTGD
jgi:hypothetical protein